MFTQLSESRINNIADEEKSDMFRIRVAPLTTNNYFVKSNEIELFLRGIGLWKYVSGSSPSYSSTNSTEPTTV